MYRKYGKRLFDLAFALPAMLLLLPMLLVIALLVRLRLGSPVLYRQTRPGLFEAPFDLYKFRTMTDAVDAEGRLLPDEQRLTSFGRLLRNTSLDELPEFFNILNGEMSLVGPRPLLMEYLATVHARAGPAPSRASWLDRVGPGKRTQRPHLE